jgi:seryl-tRNA synthetase
MPLPAIAASPWLMSAIGALLAGFAAPEAINSWQELLGGGRAARERDIAKKTRQSQFLASHLQLADEKEARKQARSDRQRSEERAYLNDAAQRDLMANLGQLQAMLGEGQNAEQNLGQMMSYLQSAQQSMPSASVPVGVGEDLFQTGNVYADLGMM